MPSLREWLRRFWSTVRPARNDADLDAELRAHLELAADDTGSLQSSGLSQAVEELRDQRELPWLRDLVRDLRYSWRLLAKHPGLTAVVVVSLAVGIGVNAAVFSFADALLLRPLSVPQPGDVLTVGASEGFSTVEVASYQEYIDIRERSETFEGLVGFTSLTAGVAVQPGAPPRVALGMLASANLFSAMRVTPALGRGFRPDEDRVPGRDAVIVLGHDFWMLQFGGDTSIVGRHVAVSGVDFRVVGVAPEDFQGLVQYGRFDFFVPIMMWPKLVGDATVRPLDAREFRAVTIKGRLKPGRTISQAQAELDVMARDFERAYPTTMQNRRMVVRTELQSRSTHNSLSVVLVVLLTLLSASVLFVACANVAGLLASQAPVRAREIALRLAIGAGRPRIMRQLLTESLLLGALGALAGLAVGYVGVLFFRQIRLPTDLPSVPEFALERHALLASLVATIVSVAIFGVVPAWRATRTDLTAVMKGTTEVRSRRRGTAFLVAGQIAVSVVMLVVGMFTYRSFAEFSAGGPGYRTDHLLMMSFDPSLVHTPMPKAQRFFEQLTRGARQLPDVKSAALASTIPMDLSLAGVVEIAPEGYRFPGSDRTASVGAASVSPDYFETIGVPILTGRGFLASDDSSAPRVAVVNERVASHYWPGRSALGQRFRVAIDGPWVQVVGVAKNSKYFWIGEPPNEFLYFPYEQQPLRRMTLLTQTSGDPASLTGPLRKLVRELDVSQPVYDVRTMDEFYRLRMLSVFNVLNGLIASMGVMGLGLALVGLYGLVAYGVKRRTHEIGIRMAIGADASRLVRLVAAQGLLLSFGGLAVGLAVSGAVGHAVAWRIPVAGAARQVDAAALVLVSAVVLAVTLLATYIPARRASRINPTEALRYE